MKALTLTQPWASLIAIGAKHIETRSWSTPYRGPLAIHASREMDDHAATYPAFIDKLTAAGFRREARGGYSAPPMFVDVPLSGIVAIVRLADCVRVETLEAMPISVYEYAFGNFEPGRWAWKLDDVVRVEPIVPCKGARGLWDLPTALEAQITAQLHEVRR